MQGRLDAARAKWDAAGFSDYVMDAYIWSFSNIGPEPIRFVVSDGYLQDAFYVNYPDDNVVHHDTTVTKLFDYVQGAIDIAADSVVVEFDEELGYPARISIDYFERGFDHEISYLVLSVNEGHDAIDAPPNVEFDFPLPDWSLESRIVTQSEIDRWMAVTDISGMDPDVPVCAVEPPAEPGYAAETISAFTGTCILQRDTDLALTLFAPAQFPEGAVGHIALNGRPIWRRDGVPLTPNNSDGYDERYRSMDLPLERWGPEGITLTANFYGDSEHVFEVRWELRDGVTGETIPGTEGSQLFYVKVVRR